jgi:coatomer subunit beta'
LVAVATDDSCYILCYECDAYTAQLESGTTITDEGVEEASDVVVRSLTGMYSSALLTLDVNRLYLCAKTGKWVGDCFIYTTSNYRLCSFVGSESYTVSPFNS